MYNNITNEYARELVFKLEQEQEAREKTEALYKELKEKVVRALKAPNFDEARDILNESSQVAIQSIYRFIDWANHNPDIWEIVKLQNKDKVDELRRRLNII
jgi:accessory colonization factor AcfC